MITVQMDTHSPDARRYDNVGKFELPAMPRTGEWIDYQGMDWRVMRVAWQPETGIALVLVRREPIYDFPQTEAGGLDDPYTAANGLLGGQP